MANRIWYLQPYDVGKNIGGCYNEQISLLPDDDWICLLDHDCMFLRPDSKKQIQEIVDKGEYELYGCMTNRLGKGDQVWPDMFDVSHIDRHINVAHYCNDFHYGQCKPTEGIIAGMLMLFRKSTWKRVGGFQENSIYFDKIFSRKIEKRAVMLGVYVFHLYRWQQPNPRAYKQHLLI